MLHPKSSRSSISSSKLLIRKIKVRLQSLTFSWKKAALTSVVAIIVFITPKFFTVKFISCSFNGKSCPQEIMFYLEKAKGRQLLFLNHREIEDSVRQLYPVEDVNITFTYPNKLSLSARGEDQGIGVKIFKPDAFPRLSIDNDTGSTESSQFNKPSLEIENFLADKPSTESGLLSSGKLTRNILSGNSISLVTTNNLSTKTLQSVFSLCTLVNKYLSDTTIYLLGDRLFLRRPSLPDIIIYVSADITQVENSLQSIDYLDTIKTDAKVIDLSFKHPIIK